MYKRCISTTTVAIQAATIPRKPIVIPLRSEVREIARPFTIPIWPLALSLSSVKSMVTVVERVMLRTFWAIVPVISRVENQKKIEVWSP